MMCQACSRPLVDGDCPGCRAARRPQCRRCNQYFVGGVCRSCDGRPYTEQPWKAPHNVPAALRGHDGTAE